MADPFVAEIRMFCGNFAPRGWAFCNGQFLPIAQNTALFSLLGTTYGGNGSTNFALPDLQGRFPMNPGTGPGLTPRSLGETGGEESVALRQSELPSHKHNITAHDTAGNSASPSGNTWTGAANRVRRFAPSTASNVTMADTALTSAGGIEPHNNLPPYATLNFIIALQGVFPPRT